MPPQPLDHDEIRLLTGIGFVAAAARHRPQAERIFDALALLRPTRSFPYIGMALTCVHAGALDDAVRALESAARWVAYDDRSDDHAQVTALRGLLLQLAGRRAAGRRSLEEAARSKADDPSVTLARRLLGLPRCEAVEERAALEAAAQA